MASYLFALLVLVLVCGSLASTNGVDDTLTNQLVQVILSSKAYPSVKNETSARSIAVLLQKQFLTFATHSSTPMPKAAPFPCDVTNGRSNPPPSDATKLRPGDIDFVGVLGDSIAAAMGALSTNIFTIFTEYRGYSYAGGGQVPFSEFITLPAILRLYNPNIRGYSVGNGDSKSANAQFNVAVSGARSYQVVPDQVAVLENKIRTMGIPPTAWKLITVFVGGNDLCDYCMDTSKNSPANYQANIEKILDDIKAKFSRVFVNLVSPPDVTLLGGVSEGFCELLHSLECDCASDVPTSAAHKQYMQKLNDVVKLPKYNDRVDFRVSLQPFLSELVLPTKNGKPDTAYFAPDCFHFSKLAHGAAAVALWNNMCEASDKLKSWVPNEPLECPSNGYLN